jgi:23S rRNA (cytidine1920-2'-O)/16S rRNA (cytidine1409-2'-O)-methyltransferase
MARRRIDAVLVDRGLFSSRERARAAVLAGEVRVRGEVVHKAGEQVAEDAVIEVAQRPRYASRGGDKLAGAFALFGVAVAGRRAIDVGASTGGFTDYLLQAGVASVAAVDVGYGQLAWQLRSDERVDVHERVNIRHADPQALGAPFDVVVADVSFISLRTILPALVSLMDDDADLLALVKPQFEVGKGRVGKRGVVKDPLDHANALQSVTDAAEEAGLVIRELTFSPIKGPEGNIEFWVWASRHGKKTVHAVAEIVEQAHDALGG